MSVHLQILICVFIAVMVSVYHQRKQSENEKNLIADSSLLVVGILSARENYAQREAARSTWLLINKTNSVKSWFILGNESCKIPPEYRLSEHGCEKWNLNILGLKDHFYTLQELPSKECSSNSSKTFHQGYSFKVNHPVIVKKLGILSHLLVPNVEIKVAILDIQSKAVIVQALLSSSGESVLIHGYIYKEIDPILLPKNYEGMVLIGGYLKHEACSNVIWNDGGGVITYNRIYSTPSPLDSMKFSCNIFAAASVEFSVHDINKLKNIIDEEQAITAQWLSHLKNLNDNVQIEKEEKKDILLVDEVDMYRNLPRKLLKFYEWVNHNHKFLYMLKTDDDCILDIFSLVQKLKSSYIFNPSTFWIWSRFRKEWPLNYIGKWADYDFKSTVYPSFPCGAAYVMSRQTTLWLSSNSKHLYSYQGEDVSMGIWLSAVNPNLIDDENFECNSECNSNSYNRAQLTLSQVYEVWSVYEKCKNLCSCN